MHAFLVIHGDKNFATNKAKEIQAKIYEFPLNKISDLRDLNDFIKLRVTEKTAITIYNFDKATTETQNAFLKSLEEPQENLYFIMTANSIDNILPTILSRCEVIEFHKEKTKYSKKEIETADKFINGTSGERFLIISKITKREDAIDWIDNLILIGHDKIFDSQKTIFKLLEYALTTKHNLAANGNVQLQLTNLVANLTSLQVPESSI